MFYKLYRYNKTERILYDFLKTRYLVIPEKKFQWCKSLSSGNNLRYDFELPELKIIIELDGPQHFKQVKNWKSPEENRKNDIRKMRLARINGYSFIRILQEDVYYNKIDWRYQLIK